MKKSSNRWAWLVAIGLLAISVCQPAVSRPIVGSIDFGGIVTYDTTSLSTATKVNLWQPNSQGPSNFGVVLQDNGDFSSISPGTNSAMNAPWTFNSGTPSLPMPGPGLNGLWSVGGFTFNLTNSTIVRQDSTFLNVTGTGFISTTNQGLDQTPGIWSFTSSKSNGATSTNFGFQATSQAVPEGGTIGLLATGFALFALPSLRRKAAFFRTTKVTENFVVSGRRRFGTIRKMKRPVLFLPGILALMLGLFATRMQAAPIQGNINFNGVVTLADQTNTNTSDLSAATQVKVWNDSWVSGVSGDFSSITPGFSTKATMAAPWVFNSGTPGAPLPGPALNSLWSVGGFTFDLTSSTVSSQSSSFLDVEGVGTIKSTNPNLSPTAGTWSFTISTGSQNGTFSFQAESAAVPEPSSVALFAISGMAAVAIKTLRRKLDRP